MSKAGSEQFSNLSKVTQLSRRKSLESKSSCIEHQRSTLIQHHWFSQGHFFPLGCLPEIRGDNFGCYTDGELQNHDLGKVSFRGLGELNAQKCVGKNCPVSCLTFHGPARLSGENHLLSPEPVLHINRVHFTWF